MKNGLIAVQMKSISPKIIREWANSYCEIWKESPWLEDFWQPEKVIEDLRVYMAKPDSVAFLYLEDESVAGFTLGYGVKRDDLRAIAGNTLLDCIFEKHNRAFYVAELGVGAKYRGHRISLILTEELLKSAKQRCFSTIVLRTDVQAHAARHVYEKLGFTDLNIHDSAYPNRTYWKMEVSHE